MCLVFIIIIIIIIWDIAHSVVSHCGACDNMIVLLLVSHWLAYFRRSCALRAVWLEEGAFLDIQHGQQEPEAAQGTGSVLLTGCWPPARHRSRPSRRCRVALYVLLAAFEMTAYPNVRDSDYEQMPVLATGIYFNFTNGMYVCVDHQLSFKYDH